MQECNFSFHPVGLHIEESVLDLLNLNTKVIMVKMMTSDERFC